MVTDAQIQAEIEKLREKFTETPELYREACALLFFRYGITPTANKLYQFVRKGSMSAPSDALSKFWDELREKSRVRIENPDLPEGVKTATGDFVATLWKLAQSSAEERFSAHRAEFESKAAEANAKMAELQTKQDEMVTEAERLHEQLWQSQERVLGIEKELSGAESKCQMLQEQLVVAQRQREVTEKSLADTRREFGHELEKLRLALQKSEERCEASEKRALMEIDRERTESLKNQKELKIARDSLEKIRDAHGREISAISAELGELKLKYGTAEGILQEMRTRNLRLEELVQSLRSSSEQARTQESIAKRDLEHAKSQIQELMARLKRFEDSPLTPQPTKTSSAKGRSA